jgi:hypothetical protein
LISNNADDCGTDAPPSFTPFIFPVLTELSISSDSTSIWEHFLSQTSANNLEKVSLYIKSTWGEAGNNRAPRSNQGLSDLSFTRGSFPSVRRVCISVHYQAPIPPLIDFLRMFPEADNLTFLSPKYFLNRLTMGAVEKNRQFCLFLQPYEYGVLLPSLTTLDVELHGDPFPERELNDVANQINKAVNKMLNMRAETGAPQLQLRSFISDLPSWYNDKFRLTFSAAA